MTGVVIVDASIAIGWVHSGQSTDVSEAILSQIRSGEIKALAPALFPMEVANVLLVLARRGRITTMECQKAREQLSKIPVSLDFEFVTLATSKLSELASEHNLSIYDAAYLEVALRLGRPLATSDGALRNAAESSGLQLWQINSSPNP